VNPRIALPLAPGLLALLLLAYLVPGLVAHDLWKTEDAIGIGIVHQMLEHGRWLVPHLAGEPYWEDGPLHYWIASLTAKAFGLIGLAEYDGARFASGLVMAAVFALVYLAGRELYGKLEAVGAVLVLVGSLGLIVHAHETMGEISMLAGQALAWYGIALARSRPRRAGWLLGLGLAVAALSKGVPAMVAPLAIALAAPLISSAWRQRQYLHALAHALLALALLYGGWLALAEHGMPGFLASWRAANAALFVVPPVTELSLWGPILAWATWPAWPIAVWTLWEARRRSYGSATRMLVFAVAASLAVLAVLADPHEIYAMPLLLPLSLLAGAGVPTLRRGAANGLAWFGVMCAAFFALLAWVAWFAMTTGFPDAIARNFTRLEPGHVQHFSWVAFTVALACTLSWGALIAKSERSAPFRSVTFWAAGITLLWALATTLMLSWIDYGKSYRQVAFALRKHVPEGARCVESRGLGEAQRAIFDYRAEIVTRRIENGGDTDCPFLLVQTQFVTGRSDNIDIGPGWKFLWEGRRPRDRERYRLYQRQP
jgi:4-amino-4-deoxy-L-arabinose transferase-like glycosyltransferase